MKKNNFTLIELLVVITIIAILASMLFPTFSDMQKKARQTASMNSLKQATTNFVGYFTDARKLNAPVPNLVTSGLFTEEHFSADPEVRSATWKVSSAEAGFGYPYYFRGNSEATEEFSIYDEEIRFLNVRPGETKKGVLKCSSRVIGSQPSTQTGTNAPPSWDLLNNSDSVIMTSMFRWDKTFNMKPVAYGDGHTGVSGFD